MEIPETGGLVFGRHAFDPARCELRSGDGPPVALGQRAGRLLHALLEHHGRVLSRNDLLREAWPGQDIPDGNLRVQIAALRRALADDRELIGTVAGRGYLFAGQVERRAAVPAPLPQPVTACVGRAALVADVLARCAATRFVTLAGAAGIGKTAVALAAARAHDGATAWVELDAIDAAAGNPEAAIVAAVLAAAGTAPDDDDGHGTSRGTSHGTIAALAARLDERQVLLVLDSCEHLADTCSRLAEALLLRCPRLLLLVTSRQPLLAQGETVVRVPALALPAPEETDAARLAACSAVALFMQRAAAAHGACAGTATSFAAADPTLAASAATFAADAPPSAATAATFAADAPPSAATAATFAADAPPSAPTAATFAAGAGFAFAADGAALPLAAAICRRLDGLPLAIELAAARVPALGLRRVAEELGDVLALLQGERSAAAPRPTAPALPPLPRVTPRHRTLRAALDWSYVLLPPAAQQALRRLAHFPSWFTLDDAVTLLYPAQSSYETIDSLASLATHSLLVVDQSGRRARYRLLATTRAYAASLPPEKLPETGVRPQDQEIFPDPGV